jgi:hypothetical protein
LGCSPSLLAAAAGREKASTTGIITVIITNMNGMIALIATSTAADRPSNNGIIEARLDRPSHEI